MPISTGGAVQYIECRALLYCTVQLFAALIITVFAYKKSQDMSASYAYFDSCSVARPINAIDPNKVELAVDQIKFTLKATGCNVETPATVATVMSTAPAFSDAENRALLEYQKSLLGSDDR